MKHLNSIKYIVDISFFYLSRSFSVPHTPRTPTDLYSGLVELLGQLSQLSILGCDTLCRWGWVLIQFIQLLHLKLVRYILH